MVKSVYTSALRGMDGATVKVETEVTPGLGIHVVGLADEAVKKSLLRVVTALQAQRYRVPSKKVIINLAPADLRKSVTGFDLAMALSIIAASEQDNGRLAELEQWLVLGELALDGKVRATKGVVQAYKIACISERIKGLIIPEENRGELLPFVSEEDGVEVFPVESLEDAIEKMAAPGVFTPLDAYPGAGETPNNKENYLYNSLYGQEERRAIIIAAAGGHNIISLGQHTDNYTLARALSEILPSPTPEEALVIGKVYSTTLWPANLINGRPFRNPDLYGSFVSLFGGGEWVEPGEVSKANNGVLFLERIAECPPAIDAAFRAVLDDKAVTISRLKGKYTFPAKFQMVAAAEPCPCGQKECTCSSSVRHEYLERLTNNEFFRHADMQVRVKHVPWWEVIKLKQDESWRSAIPFEQARELVASARQLQKARNAGRLNADLTRDEVMEIYHNLNDDVMVFLDKTIEKLSARSVLPIVRIARTVADVEGHHDITQSDVAEAATWRCLDSAPEE